MSIFVGLLTAKGEPTDPAYRRQRLVLRHLKKSDDPRLLEGMQYYKNAAVLEYPRAEKNWGCVDSFAIYDASGMMILTYPLPVRYNIPGGVQARFKLDALELAIPNMYNGLILRDADIWYDLEG